MSGTPLPDLAVWRVDVRTQSLTREPVPESWVRLGGRGLVARILVDEVPGTCDPLGQANKLVFAPGLLVGHRLSSCDRISVGGKSPLTGSVKDNAGGSTGMALVQLGLRRPHRERLRGRAGGLCTWGPVRKPFPADDLAGLGVYESARRLLR
jgi:aldehyde:ferredoxin oxidoreductase